MSATRRRGSDLATTRLLGPHLPLSVGGTLALTLSHETNRGPVETAGAALGVGGISLGLLFAVDGVTLARPGAHTTQRARLSRPHHRRRLLPVLPAHSGEFPGWR